MSPSSLPDPLLSPRTAAIFGALLVALGPVSMALYTPAMPALVSVFGTGLSAVKVTLTAYFAGFALAQLVCGPLSDAFGRRPVTLAFLALYSLASLAAALAPTVEMLAAARLVQGIGAAVGAAIARAVVRDGFTGQPAARIMNTIGIWLGIGPAISPLAGGIILALAGWRAIFLAMIAYGVVLIAVVGLRLPETNRNRDPGAAQPGRLLSSYRSLVADRRFLLPAVMLGLTLGGLYANATMLPFVLIDRVGLSPAAFGLAMIAQSGSFIAGGLVTRRLLATGEAGRLVLPGLALCALGGALLPVCVALAGPSTASVMGPVAVFAFALALFMPALTTGALAPFPERAGTASALMGFFQMGGGFAGSAVAATIGDPVLAIAIVVPAMTAMALLLALLNRAASVSR